MDIFSPLPDELTSTFDTSNIVNVIGELWPKSHVTVVRVGMFPKEKPNDHSLPVLHPALSNLNIQRS
jgi:hypothetical protein